MACQQLQELAYVNKKIDQLEDVDLVAELEETFEQSKAALTTTRTIKSLYPPGLDHTYIRDSAGKSKSHQSIDCDEVYPNIIIGNLGTAKNKEYLKRINVTHILNAAERVKTVADYYKNTQINYLGYQLRDMESTDISQFFEGAAEFIEEAVSTGGKILVHCRKGISRSATLVIAYLMIKKNLSIYSALCAVKKSRWIRPNDGFLRQLVLLDYQLHRE